MSLCCIALGWGWAAFGSTDCRKDMNRMLKYVSMQCSQVFRRALLFGKFPEFMQIKISNGAMVE